MFSVSVPEAKTFRVLWGQRSRILLSVLCEHTVAPVDQLLVALFNTAQCLFFHPFLRSLKSNGHVASTLPTSSLTIAPNIHTHSLTYSTVHAHINTQIQIHLRGVPKSFRSGRPDSESQETIGCQKGPWARLSHISPVLCRCLFRRLFYSPQKQLSIWFPLFLC